MAMASAIAAALVVTGCTADPGGTSDDPVNLQVWAGRTELQSVLEAAGKAYTAQNPHVTVTVFTTDLRGFEQKLATTLPTNTAGDVIIHGAGFMPRFVEQGIFAEPPAEVQSMLDSGSYNEGTLGSIRIDGDVWALPYYSVSTALFYNTDAFAEAGLDAPPASMDELVDYARKLAKHDASGALERSGLSLRLSGQGSGVAEKFQIFTEQLGRSVLKETSPGVWEPDIDNDETAQVLGMYLDLLKENVDNPNIVHDTEAFLSGQTAMYVRESNVIVEIGMKSPDLPYAVAPLPSAARNSSVGAWVPAASKNQETAWDFARFLAEPEQQVAVLEQFGFIPARTDISEVDAVLQDNPAFAAFMHEADGYRLYSDPKLPVWDEVQTKFADNLANAFTRYEELAGDTAAIRGLLASWADEIRTTLARAGLAG